jgi:uncharacterized protein YjaG (DUF416 family)
MDAKNNIVECCTHGNRYPAYVCQHLNLQTPVGFYESVASDPSVTYANDELNAWCDACDEVLTEAGEWNDESEAFAKIRLVCDVCFFEMKKLNQDCPASLIRMEITRLIASLPNSHQAAFCALNCEKMLPSIARFDEEEERPASDVFERSIAAIYICSVNPSHSMEEYVVLKGDLESLWPDLDETTNSFASYAFDAFGAMVEALNFVLSGDTIHAANCSAAPLDTVDMYIQEVGEAEAPASRVELEAFIQASPFMIQENKRQVMLLEELAKMPIINSENLALLKSLNEQDMLIDFSLL